MENIENYEELKHSTESFLQLVIGDDLRYALILFVILLVGVRIINRIAKIFKKKENILITFLMGCIQAFWIITVGMRIISLFDSLMGFAKQILMSSSLIVVVAGFVFQEGLTNIVHGFILTIFKPFHIGDRVKISIEGETITGYITNIDLRSTIIQNVLNSSHVIVPNSRMDMCVIENSYFDTGTASTNFLDFSVTYESDLDRAMEITQEEIQEHPYVKAARERFQIQTPVPVLIRNLEDSGIAIRATVMTGTVEENFAACSDIRKRLVYRFSQEPEVDFAYIHVQIVKGS